VEKLIASSPEFIEENGKLFVLNEMGSKKSIDDLINDDEILRDFVKKEQIQQNGKTSVKVVKSADGYAKFSHIQDDREREIAIMNYLDEEGKLKKRTPEYNKEKNRYMYGF